MGVSVWASVKFFVSCSNCNYCNCSNYRVASRSLANRWRLTFLLFHREPWMQLLASSQLPVENSFCARRSWWQDCSGGRGREKYADIIGTIMRHSTQREKPVVNCYVTSSDDHPQQAVHLLLTSRPNTNRTYYILHARAYAQWCLSCVGSDGWPFLKTCPVGLSPQHRCCVSIAIRRSHCAE